MTLDKNGSIGLLIYKQGSELSILPHMNIHNPLTDFLA
jgi:hypothetical protein